MDAQPLGMARRIMWRLTFPTVLFIFMSSLDRVNVSFAALRMNADLGFSPKEYGLGASIFFVGYLASQFPSMTLMQRIGFPKWLMLLATTWGIAAAAMAFVQTRAEFYVLRFVLGVAEGGLAPGIVIYLRHFATERDRASTFVLPVLAIPVSIVLGGPISGWLLDMPPPYGLSNWRWMFLAQGVPPILLGIAALFYFPRLPVDARWLRPDERAWIVRNAERIGKVRPQNDWQAFRDVDVWLIALLWFCLLSSSYAIMFWLPQVVGQFGTLTGFQIGLISATPWLANMLGMFSNARHSDKTGERLWHMGIPALLGAGALLAASACTGGAALLCICGVGLCLGAAQAPFWALPMVMLRPSSTAYGVVLINVIGSTGGMVAPFAIGAIKQATGSFEAAVWALAGVLLFAFGLVAVVHRRFARRLPKFGSGHVGRPTAC